MNKDKWGIVLRVFGAIFFGVIILVAFWVALYGWQQVPMVPDVPQIPDREVLPNVGLREAMFWEELEDNRVLCNLCFHRCVVPVGRRGACRVRENIAGRLYSLVHSRPSSVMIDPIEKEPQLHHRPGTEILCVGTVGCNFRCMQCHNWTLSQASPTDLRVFDLPPAQLVELALERGVTAISFTYNDPIVLFEYVYDTAVLAREAGVGLIWHSNGAIAEEPLRKLLQYTTAVTIDLKGFCEEVYREIYSGDLSYVLRTLKIIREEGVWLEIVNLVIPTINDCMDTIRAMCEWILEHLGPDVPLHFSRFFPAYRLTHLPPTPIETLEEAHRIAREVGLNFVTIGNVPGHRYNSTFCPCTGKRLIYRIHFTVIYNRVVDGRSPFSGRPVPGIWE
ncbi:AmmeMemoRadiSam system radical SAM enzyme [Dehalococcoidia bacterium]|nr:AmmeMemoRadiSam system radical SAM enzyme [Dehalococcoidia bacterium]MCL0089601.1 AmmeMemoRadiSam system radical SAM enzyme [Dehalococcoidia bacterium]